MESLRFYNVRRYQWVDLPLFVNTQKDVALGMFVEKIRC